MKRERERKEVPTQWNPITPEKYERAKEMINSGMSHTDTAASFGVSRTTLTAKLNRDKKRGRT